MTNSPGVSRKLPTVTVVTPSYNQAAFLEQTLRSVIAQRDQIHEYFVVDGGSDDGSAEIIRAHEAQIDWWVSERDRGQCDAINKGFNRATGDILYWINSDDVVLPGAIAKVREAYAQDEAIDVVSGYSVGMDQTNTIVELRMRMPDSPRRGRLGYLRIKQPSCYFSRRLYEQVGGLDESLHCVLDTELWLRMMRANTRWVGVDQYLSAYRLHDGAKGARLQDEYLQERALIREQYPEMTTRAIPRLAGRVEYYWSQLSSGRSLRWKRDARALIGKNLTVLFERMGGDGAILQAPAHQS